MNKKTIGLLAIVTTLCVGGILTVNAAFHKSEPAKAAVTTYYYGNDGSGNYRLLTQPPNLSNCSTPASSPCILMSSEQVDDFNIENPPAGTTPYPGSTNAVYSGI